VVVHKKYIPKDVMEAFKSKATILPAWDTMMERVE
jgi:aminopeptidase C